MKYLIILCLSFFMTNSLNAATIKIQMLNKLDGRNMVFSQEIVKVSPGDTVLWEATDPGHNVSFIMKGGVPEGVEKFTSKIGKDAEYTFTIPGIYAYLCVLYHRCMQTCLQRDERCPRPFGMRC